MEIAAETQNLVDVVLATPHLIPYPRAYLQNLIELGRERRHPEEYLRVLQENVDSLPLDSIRAPNLLSKHRPRGALTRE